MNSTFESQAPKSNKFANGLNLIFLNPYIFKLRRQRKLGRRRDGWDDGRPENITPLAEELNVSSDRYSE